MKAKLDEAGGLVTTQLPEAGRRVGEGAAKALKGAAANEEIGNPVREALDSAEKVRHKCDTWQRSLLLLRCCSC